MDSYQQAAAADHSKNAVAEKNALKETIIDMLRNLGLYVNAVCKGNVVMMVSSGLEISKTPTPSHVTEPVILAVKQAMNPGGISVKIATVPGAKSYLYQITLDPVTEASEWMTFGSSLSMNLLIWSKVKSTGYG